MLLGEPEAHEEPFSVPTWAPLLAHLVQGGAHHLAELARRRRHHLALDPAHGLRALPTAVLDAVEQDGRVLERGLEDALGPSLRVVLETSRALGGLAIQLRGPQLDGGQAVARMPLDRRLDVGERRAHLRRKVRRRVSVVRHERV